MKTKLERKAEALEEYEKIRGHALEEFKKKIKEIDEEWRGK